MVSSSEVAVFIDSNMGTRMALPLSPHITPSDFKRKLEMMHFNCFPEMGEIRVVGLKVKRKSTFYHLPESMLLGHVFQDRRENRFISMELRPLNDLDGPGLVNCEAINVKDQINSKSFARESPELKTCITNNGEDSTRKKKKKKKKKKKALRNNHLLENATDGSKKEFVESSVSGIKLSGYRRPVHEFEQEKKWNSSSFVETPSETSSQAISVSGIIKRFFSNSDESATSSQVLCQDIQSKPDDELRSERDGCCSNKQGTLSAHSAAGRAKRTTPFKLASTIRTPTDELKTPQVGNRLVNASSCLGHEKQGASTLCQVKSRKMSELCSSVRGLVFEMSDSDE